ncbi:MAG: YtxH domain-containing protein [Ferruginibacter sp.]
MTTTKKMLISFTAGLILGILYAPAKGSKTRKKLADVGTDIKDGWNNIADHVAGGIDRIRDVADNVADKTIESIEITQFEVNDRAGFL